MKMRTLKVTPAWLILVIDILIVLFSAYFALFLRDNFKFPSGLHSSDWITVPVVILIVRFVFFLLFKVHRQVVRYTNTTDVIKIFFSCLSGTFFIIIMNFVFNYLKSSYLVPTSVLLMEFFITLVLVIVYRFVIKIYYQESKNHTLPLLEINIINI